MTDNNKPIYDDSQYDNINIPKFEDLYKQEARRLLKMVNDQMELYYKKNNEDNVDILNLYQVIKKIENFESQAPGINGLKAELVKDMHTMIEHFFKEIQELKAKQTKEILNIKDEIDKLEKKKNGYILGILLLQVYLLPPYIKIENRIKSLKTRLNRLETIEKQEKRINLKTEQLIRVSHGFREKYLNIKNPYTK